MFALEALIVILSGFVLLRIAGKKVVAEMTPLELVTTLAVGTIIGHAVSEHALWKTILTMGIFITVLIVFQSITLKSDVFQKILVGKPTIVIKDGMILMENLSKLRMTVEQLELRIRQNGISNLSDIRTGTIEINGQFGYELIPSARPVTQKQLMKLLKVEPAPEEEPAKHDVFKQVRKSPK
ncbi:DUF421 domain-containing protein [Paenibacillus abyssi]|uniref:YetF C-terminal domain-containing protein n=1 Tax=Paenibacillus abyssi TaxID=1340531 RepID=A0A917D0K9_9BACL|nr:YetF domain-containing protein [Paenibacillus abyssi]GGG06169.1 hypothetical protein GCM10010916_23980 [Paenibacillus abyssi]